MNTYHIHIRGQVQGVGFRPFVYQLARAMGLNGWVNNTVDGVHVRFNASPTSAERFYRRLLTEAPVLSRITGHEMADCPDDQPFDDFRIVQSEASGAADLLLTPDFALCADCRAELLEPADRRHRYAFITCTNCGPRFSIIESLPYDRERTTMAPFSMCPVCQKEYDDPLDRRYYSQTNSCAVCGIRFSFFAAGEPETAQSGEAALAAAVEAVRAGAIVAVKGIGGFLLVCDATDSRAVQRLRERKRRPGKPFALMYPDLASLEGDAFLSEAGRNWLTGPVAPILLLDTRPALASGIALAEVAPGLKRVGAMLPYAPLHELLLQATGRPVVATSGNLSNTPILFREGAARRELPAVADFVLTHDRDIAVPQDDSVLRLTPRSGLPIVVRRSRGLAPTLILPGLEWPDRSLLATGASLKSTFALLHRGNVYVSQYLGDLTNFDTQEHYRHTLSHFLRLFKARPEKILTDLHPDYFSSRLGRERAERDGLPVADVQHHLAHFAAVLGEHQLLETEEPVLGVIWDGTGYGEDGQIWGGELFLYRPFTFRRLAHLPYYPHLAGDKMPREPRLSALSVCRSLPRAASRLRAKFTDTEWRIYRRLLVREDPLQTSSMGRLFDAVASLLGLPDRITYEGEAAMQLEQLAEDYLAGATLSSEDDYLRGGEWGAAGWTDRLLTGLLDDLDGGAAPARIAARFHYTLARSVRRAADEQGVRRIACSGGVFQNALLVDLVKQVCEPKKTLYFHRELSPNDEGVAFGQLVYELIRERQEKEGRPQDLAETERYGPGN